MIELGRVAILAVTCRARPLPDLNEGGALMMGCYDRGRGRSWRWLAAFGVVGVALVGSLLGDFTSAVAKSPAIPTYAARVAGGSLDHGRSWGIWVYGSRARGTCWATRVTDSGLSNVETSCGASVPPRPWQLIASGEFGSGGNAQSVLLFLTRADVGRLAVKLGTKSPRRIGVRARILSARRTERAHLHRSFGYAVSVVPGQIRCVESVSAFDRAGAKLDTKHVGCREQQRLRRS